MVTVSIDTPPSPGSFNDFWGAHGGLPEGEAWSRYSELTAEYRLQLAHYHDITPEELHLGQVSVRQVESQPAAYAV